MTIFPKIVGMNKPKQVNKQVRTVNSTPTNLIGKLSFKKPTGCGCGKKAT